MKNLKEDKKRTNQTENGDVYVATSINTCIACGREIPEGMLVCMECETFKPNTKCMICNIPLSDGKTICSKCRSTIFRSKNKD